MRKAKNYTFNYCKEVYEKIMADTMNNMVITNQ